MISIPNEENQWNQDNSSDLGGNLAQTKNITFDTNGYLRLSSSPRAAMNEAVDTDFNNPAAILFSSDYGYFIGTWEQAFQANIKILSVRPTQIATAGVPATDPETDAVWFGGLMPVTQDTDVDYYDPAANTWTDTDISLTAAGQHPAVNFVSLSSLAIANVNTVLIYPVSTWDATPTLSTTLTIPADYRITGMCYFNQNLYIGTQHIYGGHAFMYVWNGLGTAAQSAYEVDSNVIFSLCVHKDSVVMLTGNGSLLRFNGAGFDLLAGFPIFYTDQALADDLNIGLYKNIMKSNGNLLYILFNNSSNGENRLLSQPDGIWCYDENVGLYHRYSVSNALVGNESITSGNVNTTTNVITTTGNYPTGTEVVFTETFGLSPLVDGTKYYVINVSATTIKLATTLANAVAGTAIDLISSGASNPFTFFPNIDYGQFYAQKTMALNVIERPVSNRLYGTDVMWGAEVIRRDSTADYGFLGTVSDGVEARGYFITPKIFSDNVTDTFNQVTLKFSPFTAEQDKIIIKYRTYDDMRQFVNIQNSPNSWSITWTSTTTFTTTGTTWSGAVAGDEVEILQGAGGGLLAHITAISEAGGTYTVTLDDSYDNYVSGDIGIAVFRNWIKWKTITYADSNAGQYFLSDQLGVSGKFLQMKIELRGVQTRIEELMVDNKYRLPNKWK